MKIIISPAKTMQYNSLKSNQIPIFLDKTKNITSKLKKLSILEIERTMKINPKIALDTFLNYQNFGGITSPAIFSYDGLVYKNINIHDMTKQQVAQINNNVRILSALYGILKPMDNISKYRLDFTMKITINDKNLYHLWGDSIYKSIYQDTDTILNLASEEYSKLITPFLTAKNKFIDCKFLIKKNEKYTTSSTISKIARGQMVNYITTNNIKDIKLIEEFKTDRFSICKELSSENKLIFTEGGV